ncbi:MAG: hypothetical protein ACI8RD_013875 [Bacillariaceae sp.]|jgi:hypothetical protein
MVLHRKLAFMSHSVLFLVIILVGDVERISAFSSPPASKCYRIRDLQQHTVKRTISTTTTSAAATTTTTATNSNNIPNFALWSSQSSYDDEREDFDEVSPTTSTSSEFKEETKSWLRQQQSSSDNDNNNITNYELTSSSSSSSSIFQRMFDEIPFIHLFTGPEGRKKLPPLQIDDQNVLFYDVFLIVNLSISISFWVTHRLDFNYIPAALNEGCLFSILWIISGLYHGSFLYSAMDGHYDPMDDEENKGGPKAAAMLAFNTFINTINLRLIAALFGAWIQHRKVGIGSPMEELIPLEVTFGLILMTMWRALHSQTTPRI